MSLAGLRVISLESRKAKEMETLIQREQGIPFIAPSVKERAIDDDDPALRFVEKLERGEFDLLICMTGVGLTFLKDTLAPRVSAERLSDALRRVTIVSRGPKPVGVLRSLGVPPDLIIPEPNTWKEIVDAVAARSERRIAIQEYGRLNAELNTALAALGATVESFTFYRWELPDDLEPLREAARRIARRECDVVLFTSSIQLDHLHHVAAELGIEPRVREALAKEVAVGSIGPVMHSTLLANGYEPELVPRHPKMWALVKAAAEGARTVLARKAAKQRTSGVLPITE